MTDPKPTALERAIEAYFANMTEDEMAEENALGNAMASAAKRIDFDSDCAAEI